MFKGVSTFFLPSDISSVDEKRKAVLLVNFIMVLSAFSLVYLFLCYFTDIIVGVYTNIIMFPCCILALFVFRRTASFVKSASLAVLGLSAGIAEGVLFSGNVSSPAIPWLIAAPSLAFLLGNKRSGIIWTVIICLFFLAFGALSIERVDIPYLFPAYLQNYILTFTFIAVTAFISIIMSVYDNTREMASKALMAEKEKSDSLLMNILPAEIADELKERGATTAKHFDAVTVLFTDFVNFTGAAERMDARQLVDELHICFRAFDEIIGKYNIEKIKTIGDAYLAVSGLPVPDAVHAENIVQAALEIGTFIRDRKNKLGEDAFDIRIGIHSGSVVAGIVGVKKFAYDIWGDTVNIAARMEQNSEAGRINISETTYVLVKDKFSCEYRGEIEAKNKGMMKMYFIS